jgi:ABC-type multidrug transport system permease subunit
MLEISLPTALSSALSLSLSLSLSLCPPPPLSLTQGLALAMQVLYQLFFHCLLFEIWSHFTPGLAWNMIFLFVLLRIPGMTVVHHHIHLIG